MTSDGGAMREFDALQRMMSAADRLSDEMSTARDVGPLADEIARFQRGISALNGLLADTGSPDGTGDGPPSERRVVTDSSGAVRVVLASDGLPESIELDDDWRRLVGSERLTSAVTEACVNALPAAPGDAPAAGLAPSDSSARADLVDQVAAFVEGTGELPAGVPTVGDRPVRPRPVEEIMDEVLQAADAVTSLTAQWDPTDVDPDGAGPGYGISLTFAPLGWVSCTADPEWVGRQDTTDLVDALNAAVRSARSRQAESLASPQTTALSAIPDFSRLLTEIQVLVADHNRLR